MGNLDKLRGEIAETLELYLRQYAKDIYKKAPEPEQKKYVDKIIAAMSSHIRERSSEYRRSILPEDKGQSKSIRWREHMEATRIYHNILTAMGVADEGEGEAG
jgi:hypothetical protein